MRIRNVSVKYDGKIVGTAKEGTWLDQTDKTVTATITWSVDWEDVLQKKVTVEARYDDPPKQNLGFKQEMKVAKTKTSGETTFKP